MQVAERDQADRASSSAGIDAQLDAASATAPKTQRNDRDVLNLLTKRANVLHLGPANYC